jgi:hypothetical protein
MAQVLAILWRIVREIVLPLAIVLIAATLCSTFRNSDFLYFFTAALLLALWLFVTGSRIAAIVSERGWLSALPLGAAIVLVVMLGLPAIKGGDYVHLAMVYSQYSRQIRAAPGKPLSFDWGSEGFPGYGSTDYFLVYDPSGMVKDETEMVTDTDKKFPVSVKHLYGNFYRRAVYYP